ncbi:MAG: rRNA maturation RNase YbeY [Desulfuromonadaceae bacterium]|nr:rRNA maturation RNase YbeY [Desulfuromonadaceae bacterium]
MATIHLENRQKKHKIPTLLLKRAARKILNALACPDAELSIIIVSDDAIHALNKAYLQRDRPTNVISFPMQEGDGVGVHPTLLGDVAISVDTATRDALEAGIDPLRELIFLLLHGILHLLGYDHERGDECEARIMEAKEQEIFRLIETEMLTATDHA